MGSSSANVTISSTTFFHTCVVVLPVAAPDVLPPPPHGHAHRAVQTPASDTGPYNNNNKYSPPTKKLITLFPYLVPIKNLAT